MDAEDIALLREALARGPKVGEAIQFIKALLSDLKPNELLLVLEAVESAVRASQADAARMYIPGTKVALRLGAQQVSATVIRFNLKTVTVRLDDGRVGRVPPSFLHLVEEGGGER